MMMMMMMMTMMMVQSRRQRWGCDMALHRVLYSLVWPSIVMCMAMGVAHWQGCYFKTDAPFLLDGAR
jgi:hypothetical protein